MWNNHGGNTKEKDKGYVVFECTELKYLKTAWTLFFFPTDICFRGDSHFMYIVYLFFIYSGEPKFIGSIVHMLWVEFEAAYLMAILTSTLVASTPRSGLGKRRWKRSLARPCSSFLYHSFLKLARSLRFYLYITARYISANKIKEWVESLRSGRRSNVKKSINISVQRFLPFLTKWSLPGRNAKCSSKTFTYK